MANESLEILIHFDVKEENVAAFGDVTRSLVASIGANEPRTERYSFYVSPDGRSAVLHERYPDSAAYLAHMDRTKGELPALLAVASPASFYVLGEPSAAARESLVGFGAKILGPGASLAR